jgi:hypothetical protein
MSDPKDKIPGRKGKFLYLDKFVAHLQEDKSWKDNAVKIFKRLNRLNKLNTWAQILNFLLAAAALGIALVK